MINPHAPILGTIVPFLGAFARIILKQHQVCLSFYVKASGGFLYIGQIIHKLTIGLFVLITTNYPAMEVHFYLIFRCFLLFTLFGKCFNLTQIFGKSPLGILIVGR